MKLKNGILKAFIFCFCLTICSALTVVQASDKTKEEIKPLHQNLIGTSDYSWLVFDVYKASLWAESPESIFTKVHSLELKYKRDFEGEDIVKQSKKELVHIGVDSKIIDKWYPKLLEIFPDVKEGDRILANYNSKEGVSFYLNRSKSLGKISDPSFAKMFMGIWLHEKTSAQNMRKELLGEK